MAEPTAAPHHNDFASSFTASCSASTTNVHYDIFINHCGRDPDACSFATALYSQLISRRLQVFLHNLEYMFEEEFSSEIEAVISQASVLIAIFSPNYAQWKWCLDALVHMRKSGVTILPIFYKVNPYEIRRTGKDNHGPYAQWLRGHEEKERYDSDTIQNWRDVLSHVSEISGFELEACNGDEEELLREVVKSVFKDFPSLRYHVFLNHRGPDSKTTLASQLYDRLTSRGLRVFLDKPELVEGVKIDCQIEVAIQFAVVHIAIFSPNYAQSSWCLDELYLMTMSGAIILPVFYKVKSSVLDEEYAKALVDHENSGRYKSDNIQRWRRAISEVAKIKCIFEMDGNEEELFDEIVQTVFKNVPERSQVVHNSEVQSLVKGVLKESVPRSSEVVVQESDPEGYFGLAEKLIDFENMVLSAHTERVEAKVVGVVGAAGIGKTALADLFFTREDIDKATRICGLVGISSLGNKCLVGVDNENKLYMHHRTRDFGRHIAKGSTPRRLWHQTTDIINNLLEQSSYGLSQIRGITMIPPIDCRDVINESGACLRSEMTYYKRSRHEMFHVPKNLKFLAAQDVYVEDILRRVGSPGIIWLHWYNCPYSYLPSWIPMENLRVLELAGSKLTELWRPESQAPLQLRELNIFAPLSVFPKSIGQLKHLEKIVVKCFDDRPLPFRTLPEELCHLLSLKYLELRNCSRMTSLPDSFGELTNLQYLDLRGASSLHMLPNSIGKLSLLKNLCLKDCLDIQELPGVEHLSSLKCLDVSGCEKLHSIPGLGQLQTLDVSGCRDIQQLPGMEHGTSLKWLNVRICEKLFRIHGLGQLTELRGLIVQECREIQELPSLEHLTSLWTLDVRGCQKLQSIPGLGHLTSLGTLSVMRCDKLHSIPGLGQLTKLGELFVQECREIQELPILEHLTYLSTLDVRGCQKLQSIPGLEQLTKLRTLYVQECHEIRELPGVEYLTSLEKLSVSQCKKLESIQGLGQLTKLQTLHADGCSNIRELPGMEHVTALETLDVRGCEKLQSIPGLGQLTKLRFLYVEKIKEFPGVEHLTSLETLDVRGCQKLQSIPGLEQLTKLRTLNVQECHKIQELSGVEYLTSLETLSVMRCDKLHSIPGLGQLTKLRTLCVKECRQIQELPSLEHLTSLERLDVSGRGKLQCIPGLGHCVIL